LLKDLEHEFGFRFGRGGARSEGLPGRSMDADHAAGRPSVHDNPGHQVVSAHVERGVAAAIRARAQREDRSVSAVIRRALEAEFKEHVNSG
jgi:hypothetical protein